MSSKIVDELFNRLMCDQAFRELLRRDPEQALAGYDLTPTERAKFAIFRKRSRQVEENRSNYPFSLN